jgi:signal transduction histidine kinase
VASLAAGAAHEINNPLAVVMGQAQLLAVEVVGPGRQRVAEMLEAVDRIRAIVARMRRLTRVELMDSSPGLPPMLDINRSSEPDVTERPAASSCLVIVAREERARCESLRRMFAGDGTDVIVDRRLGERRRSGSAAGGRRLGPRRRQDISLDLQTRGWALVRR